MSEKADARKKAKLVMPVSLEDQLKLVGFSAKAIQDAAESVHLGKSETTMNKDTTEIQNSTKRTKTSQPVESKRSASAKQPGLTKEEQRNIDEKIKQLKLEGRMLPNSAMTTYFGKPAFHAYGNANTKPTYGGPMYGSYMKTHNINPHSGDNHPEFTQVYAHAMLEPKSVTYKMKSKSPKKAEMDRTIRRPEPPRQQRDKRPLTAKQLNEQQVRSPIT